MVVKIKAYSDDFHIQLVHLLKDTYGDIIDENGIVKFAQNKDNRIIIATHCDNLIGCAFLEVKQDMIRPYKFCFVTYVSVDKAYRRQGVATNIFNFIERIAVEEGCTAIELTSANHRIDAHSFYDNIGFSKKNTTVFIKELGGSMV